MQPVEGDLLELVDEHGRAVAFESELDARHLGHRRRGSLHQSNRVDVGVGDGTVVEIDHPGGIGPAGQGEPVRTRYAHLASVDADLRPGLRVGRGVALGASGGRPGRDGVSTGAHLHFEVRDAGGRTLDPARLVRLPEAASPAPRWTGPTPPAEDAGSLVPPTPDVPAPAADPVSDSLDADDDGLPELVLPDYPLALAACGDAGSDERADMPGMGAEAMDDMHEMPDGSMMDGAEHEHQASADGEAAAPEMVDGVQVVEVEAGRMGYQPRQIALEAGVPARLVFTRTVEDECSSQITLPAYDVPTTDLPLGEPVAIEFTPTETGEVQFVCGMDMQRGTIAVVS